MMVQYHFYALLFSLRPPHPAPSPHPSSLGSTHRPIAFISTIRISSSHGSTQHPIAFIWTIIRILSFNMPRNCFPPQRGDTHAHLHSSRNSIAAQPLVSPEDVCLDCPGRGGRACQTNRRLTWISCTGEGDIRRFLPAAPVPCNDTAPGNLRYRIALAVF